MVDKSQIMQIIETGLKAARQELLSTADTALPVFEVRPIGNGFVVQYNDVEEYETKVPVYEPPPTPAHGGVLVPRGRTTFGEPPKMESQRRWKFKRAEVFCADAAAIKAAVDEALQLEEKVKQLVAEGVLGGNEGTGVELLERLA